jgi:hypothetical protein
MAVPRKAISQKNSAGACSGLIFEGCHTKALAEFFVPKNSKLSQTLKDQFAFPERHRYRLEGNGHPCDIALPLRGSVAGGWTIQYG